MINYPRPSPAFPGGWAGPGNEANKQSTCISNNSATAIISNKLYGGLIHTFLLLKVSYKELRSL